MAEIDLLAIERGTVTAPAGCGKTHLIADALTRHDGLKPILVLTHTNAGVAALRGRLQRAAVPPAAYRLATIDGWAMRLLTLFPRRSGHDPAILTVRDPRRHYPAIRTAARGLLAAGHINDVVASSYDRLIVDEYQDCSVPQHEIILHASQTLRTCVLGDPLQAIFNFAGPTVDWAGDVQACFPAAGELVTPWRWINAGEEAFGRWLLGVRETLLEQGSIDLGRAPATCAGCVSMGWRITNCGSAPAQFRCPGRTPGSSSWRTLPTQACSGTSPGRSPEASLLRMSTCAT